MPSIFGRSVIDTPTNKSGGALAKGDVVIVDTTNDHAITTTTSAASTAQIGVVVEENGIANNVAGRVAVAGYVPLINVNASVTRGHYAGTHTVAKQAASLGASRALGAFGQFLTGGTTPTGILFGLTDAAGTGGGAPTTSTYLTGSLDAGLSAEKVRADLYKNYHPDNYPTSGLTLSDEFDDSSLDAAWTWDSAPGGTVSESTYPGFLYITGGSDASATQRILRRAFVPGAAAFSVAVKCSQAIENGNYAATIGIRLVDSSDVLIWQAVIAADGTATAADGYRIISTASTWITAATVPLVSAPQYLLITRSAANVYKGYSSADGIVWQYLGTSTVATTVSKVCIVYGVDSDALDDDATFDFVRVFTTETKKIGA